MSDPLRTIRRRVEREIDCCLTEIDRLRQLNRVPLSTTAAVGASVLVVALGNGVVVLGCWLRQPEWTTLLAVPTIGAAGAYWLWRRGWAWQSLGFGRFAMDAPARVPRLLFMAALVLLAGSVTIGLLTGKEIPLLNVVRLIVGTAIGEEVIHRSIILGIWASTSVGRRWVVVANMVIFSLWHLAGARDDGRFDWGDIVAPGFLALFLLWARLRVHSVFAPAALHAGGNATQFLPWVSSGGPPCG